MDRTWVSSSCLLEGTMRNSLQSLTSLKVNINMQSRDVLEGHERPSVLLPTVVPSSCYVLPRQDRIFPFNEDQN